MSNTAIEDAIRLAQANAGNVGQQADAALGGGGAVTQYNQGGALAKGANITFDDLNQGGLNVSTWLKLDKAGIRVGNDMTMFDELEVVLPLDEVGYCYSIRFGVPAQYRKSYDHITDVRGGAWVQSIAEAQKVDPKAKEFRSADIPFYSVNELKSKKGEVLASPGDAMGHSLSVTGWRGFAGFITSLQRQGIDTNNSIVKFTLGHQYMKNPSGEWGLFTYTNPEVLPAMPF